MSSSPSPACSALSRGRSNASMLWPTRWSAPAAIRSSSSRCCSVSGPLARQVRPVSGLHAAAATICPLCLDTSMSSERQLRSESGSDCPAVCRLWLCVMRVPWARLSLPHSWDSAVDRLQFKGIAFWPLPDHVVFITIIASCAFILLEPRKCMPLAGVKVDAGPAS